MIRQYREAVCLSVIVFFMVSFFYGMAVADEVILENGDRLTGTVTKLEKGTLTIETGYSEPVNVLMSRIKSIKTDTPVVTTLVSGEVLRGKIKSDEKGNVVIEATDGRGKLVSGWDQVLAINAPTVEPSQWNGSVNIGALRQTGNSERTNITFGTDAVRRTEQDRISLRFLYNYAEEENNVTARSYYGVGKYDYFFTRVSYGYIAIEMLKDKTKDLELRTVVGPGVGYQFWDDAVKSLLFEAVLAYFSENVKKGTDRDWIAARLAADLRYALGNDVVFTDLLVVYPSLENAEDYKLRNEAALTSPLASGWSLRLANIIEHDGNPPRSIKSNDVFWLLSLQYAF